jgi:tripartite-type tricarboxylate transporter receptor subunit TctC
VDNRPGAGSTIGTKAVASAIPDGSTLLFISSSLVIDPVLYRSSDYDPIKSLAPIAAVAATPWVMVVTPRVPAGSAGELVAYAKANPGKLNFGYALGTASQLVGEMFKISTGTDITSIPYKGGTGVVPDMLGGRIDLYFGTAATILPLIREGKLNALAITSATRSPQLPDVPTMIESGLPELSLTLWQGMPAPAGTPGTHRQPAQPRHQRESDLSQIDRDHGGAWLRGQDRIGAGLRHVHCRGSPEMGGNRQGIGRQGLLRSREFRSFR